MNTKVRHFVSHFELPESLFHLKMVLLYGNQFDDKLHLKKKKNENGASFVFIHESSVFLVSPGLGEAVGGARAGRSLDLAPTSIRKARLAFICFAC